MIEQRKDSDRTEGESDRTEEGESDRREEGV